MGYIFDALNKGGQTPGDQTPSDEAADRVTGPDLTDAIDEANAQVNDQHDQDDTPLRLPDVTTEQAEDTTDEAESESVYADAMYSEEVSTDKAAETEPAKQQQDNKPPLAIAGDTGSIDTDTDTSPLQIETAPAPPAKGWWNRLMGRHLRGKVDDRLVAMTSPASAMSEEYRSIRTSILARHDNERHLVHTISSATPQEGKTITCVNLGLSFAELRNRNTVIIECDLRLPTFSKLLSCDTTKPGLIDFLHGEAQLKDVVQKVENSALHIIPAGGRVSDEAVQLLSSGRMSRLIQALRIKYDHVLIDTPPVLTLADAGILGSQSEEVLLVARMRRTPRTLVEQAVDTLTSYNAVVSGIIATDNPRSRGRGYGYKYGYGYRYGYGYGYGYTDDGRKKRKRRDAA